MLNAMPMPTATSDITGGPVTADVSRAASRQRGAGSQDADSFASTLASLHKKETVAHQTSTSDRDEPSTETAETEVKPENGEHSDTATGSESPVETAVTDALMPVPAPGDKSGANVTDKGFSESQPVLTATDDKMTAEAVDPAMEGAAKSPQKINAPGAHRPSVVVVAEQTEEGAKAGPSAEAMPFKGMNRAVTQDEIKPMTQPSGEAHTRPLPGNEAPAETSSVSSEPEGQAKPKSRPAAVDTAAAQNDGEDGGPVGKSAIETGKRFAHDVNEQVRPLKHQEGGRQGAESDKPSPREHNLDGQERTARPSASADTGVGGVKIATDTGQDAFAKMTPPEDSGPAASRPSAMDSGMPFTTTHAGGKTAPAPGSPIPQSTPAATETFQSDNFNNLVEKALFTVRGGQSEARIALKPDQLGHVQMKIATENHIVTVKIVTESPVARDLIDANANQLRAELQQQGLNVESIEVSVSDDQRDAYRGARQRETFMRHMASNGKAPHEEETPADWEQRPGQRKPNTFGATGIDYFA